MNFNQKGFLNVLKRFERWNILLIDDHGKVISFRYLKVLLMLFLLVILILLATSLYLFTLNKSTLQKNQEIRTMLEASGQEKKDLQQEIRALMIQLAKAHTKAQTSPQKRRTKPSQARDAGTKTVKSSQIKQTKASGVLKKKASTVQPKPEKTTSTGSTQTVRTAAVKPQKLQTRKPATEKKKAADVSNFLAFRDASTNTVHARFSIKNLLGKSQPLSGYIFIIMKEKHSDQKKWVPIPLVELVSGKPLQIKNGVFFKIRNYKEMDVRGKDITGPKSFTKATILIFSPSGDLVLEETHPVIINVPTPPAKTPAPDVVTPPPDQKKAAEAPEVPAAENATPETTEPDPIPLSDEQR